MRYIIFLVSSIFIVGCGIPFPVDLQGHRFDVSIDNNKLLVGSDTGSYSVIAIFPGTVRIRDEFSSVVIGQTKTQSVEEVSTKKEEVPPNAWVHQLFTSEAPEASETSEEVAAEVETMSTYKICIKGDFNGLEACYENIISDADIGKEVQIFEKIGSFQGQLGFYVTTKDDGLTQLNLRDLGMILPLPEAQPGL